MPVSKSTKELKATPTLKYWTVKLKDIQSSFTDIWEFVETFQEGATLGQISVRLNAIDDLWERFGEVLTEIKSHEDFSGCDEIYDKERKELSDRYYYAKSFLMDRTKERQNPHDLDQSSRTDLGNHSNVDHVRLPQIKLQCFDGNIDEWLGFRDLYLSLIHWKQELPEVEKFHYLKGCLQGEPKALIDPLQITKSNYIVAWDMLLKRYNNSEQLKKRQVQSLFKLPSMVKESVAELQTLLEGFERIVNTLDQVLESAEYKDLLLVNFLVSLLDPVTRRSWEEDSSTKESDTLSELTEFLHRRVRVLEALPPKPSNSGATHSQVAVKPKGVSIRTYHNNVKSSFRCPACKDGHFLYQCQRFLKLAVDERDSLLKDQSLCRNCFKSGHMAKECNSKFWCRNCKGRHHTLVCFKGRSDGQLGTSRSSGSSSNKKHHQEATTVQTSNSATTCMMAGASEKVHSQVLLATAIVFIEDEMGSRFPARALLDSGSESNFISEGLSQQMKLSRKRVDVSILGIGQATTRVKHKIDAVIHSRVTRFSKEMSFLILPKVTVDLPTTSVTTDGWVLPSGIDLADPSFFQSRKVDLVLGIESFFEYFKTGKRMSIGDNLPTLTESVFGWVVSGGMVGESISTVSCNVSTGESLESLVSRFWACEEVGSEKLFTEEEQMCEDYFQRTVQRNSEGRYTVALPKHSETIANLGDSKEIAFRRLKATERRLDKNPELRGQYTAFMNEYLDLGHMQRVTSDTAVKRCFLPHHPVVKESSTTTKVRVVFDASCKTSTGISLNDGLLCGPVIQDELRSIILRCRTKQVMVVADIEKMFRQILIAEEDRIMQSILWRNSPTDEVGVYELSTVTYGTKPAPATRTLKQLALDEQNRYPLAAKVFLEDTYMDDVIAGAEDAEAAFQLRTQLENAAASGGFRLRKFASNSSRVLEGLTQENVALKDFSEDSSSDPSMKILGLTWLPKSDIFRYQFSIPEGSRIDTLTKRKVLAIIATLFDPLGLLGAAITTAKVFMQQLWLLQDDNNKRLDWDQPLPLTVGEFMGELPSARVTVSRAFQRTGVDYFGPVYLRTAPRRSAVKAYVAVFVCMVTKAVHLELVTDLSTEKFIQALRRFVGRRGKCTDLYSDNGTNFVGARNQLNELFSLLKSPKHREDLTRECSNVGISWHFNPPSAPHFGGLWEAAVRSAKQHILKVVGEHPVTVEDYTTLLVQVEACLNSRPLTSLSDNPEDLEPLTPGHFLIGESLQSLPDSVDENIPDNRLKQFQLMQKRLRLIWNRWRREYLAQLQARTKRWKPAVSIKENSLVIIKDDRVSPCRWKMGRIVELHPGDDGVVRVVTLRTDSGLKIRPVEKLCLLPCSYNED
ncbi:uncharacterized protein LOC129738138 [Uranotaenia lowii]|uniref:uncharacterized protein LOC129738138 n=1 Tax=Uranotaenia lowii TaxID=190385 RepID=UPI00247991A0|nr:uncharacterized protein LOC129738138 [Uranotaenia lowii]